MECAYPTLMKIPDQVGFMVICDRTVLISHGELANHEEDAQTVSLILNACRSLKPRTDSEGFHSINIQFSKHFYVITKNANQIYVVKRRIKNPTATTTDDTLTGADVPSVPGNDRCTGAVIDENAL